MDYALVVTFVTYDQGICPKERGKQVCKPLAIAACVGTVDRGEHKVEGTSQVGDVEGITIEDQGVVKGEDKWSFVRGGVFVIVGGVANITMGRTPLPFRLKMGGGIIQNKERDGSDNARMDHVVADSHNSDWCNCSDEDYVSTRDKGKTCQISMVPISSQIVGRKKRRKPSERASHVNEREGGISGNDLPHSTRRKLSYVPQLPDPRSIQCGERKDAVHQVQVSAVIGGSRWILGSEINPDDVNDIFTNAMPGGGWLSHWYNRNEPTENLLGKAAICARRKNAAG